jgi:hypothetical protein
MSKRDFSSSCGSVSFFLSDKELLAESFYYAASSFNKSLVVFRALFLFQKSVLGRPPSSIISTTLLNLKFANHEMHRSLVWINVKNKFGLFFKKRNKIKKPKLIET